jgi:hypothetical protein
MPKTDFHERNAIRWGDALRKSLGAIPARTSIWVGDQDIMAVLKNFMGANFNHAHLPTGGGFDYREVAPAFERNCIEFKVEDKLVDIAKPERLVLWHFPQSPRNSFLLLELAKLKPTGVYEDSSEFPSEELVDIGRGRYLNRSVWDDGFYGYDEHDREKPLPDAARLVTRWLSGKILLVAKGSLWNGDPDTYDARHSRMTAEEIAIVIERSLRSRSAA